MLIRIKTCLAVTAMMSVLAGCSTARIAGATFTSPGSSRPVELLVEVSSGDLGAAPQAAAVTQTVSNLRTDLVKELTAARVFAEPYSPSIERHGTAVLRVTITAAKPGNAAERLIIGFGVGRAELQATAELLSPEYSGNPALARFSTSSNSGVKPGLLMPGGIAVATGKAVHLAIAGGVDVALNTGGGLSRPTQATSRAIVHQLETYYRSVGWYWPAASPSVSVIVGVASRRCGPAGSIIWVRPAVGPSS
jgi:hypothetical protein